LARLESRAELAGNHAAGLVDLHNPGAAKKLDIVVHGALDNARAEAQPPRVSMVCELFPHGAQGLA